MSPRCGSRWIAWTTSVATLLVACAAVAADEEDTATTRALARELAEQGDPSGAAVEYRRLALREQHPLRQGGWRWMAAWEYWHAGRLEQAEALLDRVEAEAPTWMTPTLLLRAEIARSERKPAEAAFYFDSFAAATEAADARAYARRAAIAARLEGRDAAGARAALADWPDAPTSVAEAVENYVAGRDKNPQIGGWLGLVPGLGYAYANEYANAARSLILNGLFLYGMHETAQDEQWGAFAVIAFFEFTWYSGSVYGGLDASHRYNRRRADDAAATVRGGAAWRPDESALPTLSLLFTF